MTTPPNRTTQPKKSPAATPLHEGALRPSPAKRPSTDPVPALDPDDLYRVPVDPVLERHLRNIHDAVTRHTMEGEPGVAPAAGVRACALCADEMRSAGLPYRI